MRASLIDLLQRHYSIVLVLTFVAPWYLLWMSQAVLGDIGTDGPEYLLMAQHYSPFGTQNPVYQHAATYTRFPPMYPLVLALTGAADDLARAHLVTFCFFLLALLAFYIYLQRMEMPAKQSSLLVLLFAALPGSWALGLFIQSEYLYLTFSLLALTLMAMVRPGAHRNVLVAAALITAIAILTRTVGISLLVPLVLVLVRARVPLRDALTAISIALFPLLAWNLVHESHSGYVDALHQGYDSDGWMFLVRQLAVELPALHKGFGDNFLHDQDLRPLADALGVLCMAATAWRAIKLKPDAIYILAQSAILLVWPYPDEARRLLWVLLPLIPVQPLLGYSESTLMERRGAVTSAFAAGLAAVILTMTLPALAFAADRYRAAAYFDPPGAGSFLLWYRSDRISDQEAVANQILIGNALLEIREYVPASDCVISTRPDMVDYFGWRRSVPPPPDSISEPYFTAAIRGTGCHYIFGMIGVSERYPRPFYPLPRLESNIEPLFVSTAHALMGGEHPPVAVLARLP